MVSNWEKKKKKDSEWLFYSVHKEKKTENSLVGARKKKVADAIKFYTAVTLTLKK